MIDGSPFYPTPLSKFNMLYQIATLSITGTILFYLGFNRRKHEQKYGKATTLVLALTPSAISTLILGKLLHWDMKVSSILSSSLTSLYYFGNKYQIIGITGGKGTGKSTVMMIL